MQFSVKKGKFAFKPRINLGFFLLKKPMRFKQIKFSIRLSKELLFSDSDMEDLGVERLDWLKATGISSSKNIFRLVSGVDNNRDSILIAFRPHPDKKDVFQVGPYFNKGGAIEFPEAVLTVAPDEVFYAMTTRQSENRYELLIEKQNGEKVLTKTTFNENKLLRIVPPWHGGTAPARRNAKIYLSWAK